MSGIYSLISSAKAIEKKMEISANNLTNSDTAGYKTDHPTFREILSNATRVAPESEEELFQGHEYLDLYVGMDKSSVAMDHIGKDFTVGEMRYTENPLDLAIDSDGFFTVATPQGDRYTRTGEFTLDAQRRIVTQDGHPLLGEKGTIQVNGADLKIDENGGVHVDGEFVDNIRLIRFRNPANLQKLGKSFYAPVGSDDIPVPSKEVLVRQGMIEESNVNTVKEMVGMVNTNRSYEAVRKAMTMTDRLDEKAISISRIA